MRVLIGVPVGVEVRVVVCVPVDVRVRVGVGVAADVRVMLDDSVLVAVDVGVLVGVGSGKGATFSRKIGNSVGGMAFHTVLVSQHPLKGQ